MKWAVTSVLIVLLASTQVESDGNYIFTAPAKLQMGGTESVCILLSDFNEDVFVQIRLVDNGTVLQSMSHTFKGGEGGCVDFPVPLLTDRENSWEKDDLEVIGVGQETDQRFEGLTHVNLIERQSSIVFLQTDKPLYKPGQLVRFRVLAVDEQLRPVASPITIDLRNPILVTLAHWEDQQSQYGLHDFEFQLSKEPVMGTWTIEANLNGTKYPTSFKVEEYVLPKYEVTVTPPPYIQPWTPFIEGEVCAKYTYGKPVKGKLRLEVCLDKGYAYYYREASDDSNSNSNKICTQFIEKIDGCQKFSVNGTVIGLPYNTYSVWSAKVRYNASVLEEATGVTLYGSSESGPIETKEVTIAFEEVSEYYKPGLPFTGKVVVTRPDKSAAPGEPIRLTAMSYFPYMRFERNFTTDIHGSFYFALPAEAARQQFNIEATALRYERGAMSFPENYHQVSSARAYRYLKPWYSPSNSFLDISSIRETVKCGGDIPVQVTYSTPPDTTYNFHYQILVRGNIVRTGSVENAFAGSEFHGTEENRESLIRITTIAPPPPPTFPNITLNWTESTTPVAVELSVSVDVESSSREKREVETRNSTHLARFEFTIPLTSAMAGGGRLLVYYIREDKEVVAGHAQFKAGNCVDNKVEMSFADSPVFPGDPATLQVSASPGSLCGIGVVDKSVLLLGGQNQLTLEQVMEFLRNRDPLRYPSAYLDYKEANIYCLDKVGIPEKYEAEVDERLLRLQGDWWQLPFRYQVEQVDSMQAFQSTGLVTATNLRILTRPCVVSDQRRETYYRRKGARQPIAVMSPGVARTATDAVMFESPGENTVVKAEETKARTYFPETWLWDIEKIGDDGRLTLKKPIPDAITEWVGSTVCTNTKTGLGVSGTAKVTAFKPFFASYTLPYSVIRGERIPIPVTVFNYLTDCLAIRLDLDVSKGQFELEGVSSVTLCVCGQDSETHRFLITPNTLGDVNITVDARSVTDAGYCSNSLVMSTEGIGVRDILTRPLLVESEGIPEEYTRSIFVCPKGEDAKTAVEEIDMLLPDNVILDSARGYVTVIGDLMGSALNNLDNLVKMPYGCGEQNMASFTPNIYVMEYLYSTNRLTQEISDKATNYMKIGYQRQLRYRHKDGSYSAFGERDGSSQPGSSWLTAFVVKSLAKARPYIFIDQKDLDQSINFFKSSQDNETGCFPKIGQTSAYLKGGLEGQANSTLTAYILIALLEADTASQDPVVQGAVKCIMNDEFDDVYTIALSAYALTLYDEGLPFRHELMSKLRDTVIEEEGQQHWERADKPERPQTRWWWYYTANSAEVEITAYALMALIVSEQQGGIIIGQPIVQWLSRQRNSYGGFSSTQDTVVALQALAEYGTIAYTDGLDMAVTVSDDEEDLVTVELSDTDSLIPTRQRIDTLPTQVKISASGDGCAMIQANARYNVEGQTPKDPAFTLDIKMFQSVMEPTNCDRQRMQICTRFTVSGQVSNMAIIEVKMVTGWIPDEKTLKDLVKLPLWGIQRYEIDNNVVNFYFDEISAQKSCVYFEVIRELEVNNTQPGRVHVYDYYETDYSVISPYEIEPQCNTFQWRPIFFDALPRPRNFAAGALGGIVEPVNATAKVDEASPVVTGVNRCPYCPESRPDNFEDLICSSDVAYKTQAGRTGDFKLKIRSDFRPASGKVEIEKFSNFALPEGCSCDALDEDIKVFVLGPKDIFDESSKTLRLDGSVTVVRLMKGLDKQVRRVVTKSSCK
ncbi:alpha-2-macroglobulin-like isoform X2 [Liolophura sinensis]|uniref:alpha-2-macroglobulin-like isoform X2 n=1 Tax=Liolophura sinensis TaxID=3198878 RepID=UPI00315951AA